MPTYEYECTECSQRFDVFQKMTDSFLKECPKCKGKVKRLIGSGSGMIFKGSGFFATDYKKKPQDKTDKTDKKPKEPCSGCSDKTCPKTPKK